MAEKIKAYAEAVKAGILYILGPIFLVGWYVYYLIQKNKALQDQLKMKDGDKRLQSLEEAAKAAEKEANEAEDSYADLVAKYRAEHKDDG